MATIVWRDDDEFTVDDVVYRSMVGRTDSDQMVVLKPRSAVEAYVELIDQLQPRTILELGIYNGGSAALFAQLIRPTKLVVVDIRESCEHLEHFLDAHDLRGTVVPYYGVDQANTDQLDEIMAAEFDGPIDLVIDDASHLLRETPASFNRLFPHVRDGGLYVVEDWAWAHTVAHPDPGYQDVPSMSPFVFELTVVAGRRPRIIPELSIDSFKATVRRGPADLRPERFILQSQLGEIGAAMVERMSGVRSPVSEESGGT